MEVKEPSAKYLARPRYKQTEVGLIPEDWEVKPLHSLAERIMVGIASAATHAYRDKGIVMFRNQNIKPGYLDDSDLLFIAEDYEETFRNKRLEPGDLLTARTGYPGTTSIVPVQYEGAQSFTTLITRPRSDIVRSDYLCTFINSEAGRSYFEQNQIGGGQKNVNAGSLKNLPVAFPTAKAEQKAIAKTLSDADALIDSLEQLLAKKRQLKQGAMQELLRPKESDAVRALGEISSLKGRIGWQGLKQTEFTTNDDEPFLVTGMNFKDGAIRWSEVYHIPEARYAMAPEIQLRPDDVLMTKDGTIGKVLYIDTIPYPGKASLNSHLLLFRPIGGSYQPKYLYYQLSSRRFKDFVELSKSGTTFFGLSQAAVAAYPVLLPPMPEQERIATTLNDMDIAIAALEEKLAKARQIKQGMMQDLLTGRIRLV